MNPVVQKIAKKRMLDLGDLTVEEMREIQEFEKNALMQSQSQQQSQPMQGQPQQGQISDQVLSELQNYATSGIS